MSNSKPKARSDYEDAMCPGCGRILTGSREPGDEDHCQKTGEDVVLVEVDSDAHERGGAFECGKCRVALSWDPVSEEYTCPECGWSK